jgi:hypothetical protein
MTVKTSATTACRLQGEDEEPMRFMARPHGKTPGHL